MSDRLDRASVEFLAAIRAEIADAVAKSEPSDRDLLSMAEAASVLGISRSMLYDRLVGTGKLRTVKVGRRRLVARADLLDYIATELVTGDQT